MTFRDLQYLVALADLRHFRRAAESVHVSQPTLSGQIRKLEDMLGIVLFERDGRSIAPTPAGDAIIAEARHALAHAAAIRDIANAFRDPLAGPLRLGLIASLGPYLVPDLIAQVGHDAPRLELIVSESLTPDLITAVRTRELDAAVIATPADEGELVEYSLFDEPFLLAHAPDHPLAAIAAPSLAEIERGTLLLLTEGHCLRDQALSLCGAASVDSSVKAASLVTLIRLVERGHGVTLLPELAAIDAGALTLRRLPGTGASRHLRLIARRAFPRPDALRLIAKSACIVARASGLSVPGA